MKLYVNSWYSAWLARKSYDMNRFVLVDEIRTHNMSNDGDTVASSVRY